MLELELKLHNFKFHTLALQKDCFSQYSYRWVRAYAVIYKTDTEKHLVEKIAENNEYEINNKSVLNMSESREMHNKFGYDLLYMIIWEW
ncbi:hypothetical protein LCGC14_0174350 [marine sediment metagenome]|uniref:Uncharacterized protein n=1 Tax=marine sediment metagenome TaxID=412755 RepID=A0A0F9V775_9ZZZZ